MKTANRMLIASLVLVLAEGVAVYAGESGWAKMKADLGLSDAQVAQLEQKFAELKPMKEKAMAINSELKALEGAASPDLKAIDAKKAELMSLKKDLSAKADAIYRSVLTKEQYTKLQAWQEDQKKQHAVKKQ